MFEVAPPGQAVKITKPTANSGVRGKAKAIRKPTAGNKISWAINPKITALGSRVTRLKSSKVNPKPMLIIMINKAKGRKTAVKKLDSIE